MDDLLLSGNDLLDMPPELAGLVLEYRHNKPDLRILIEIMVACAESGDTLPPDLLRDAAEALEPDYIPNETKREKRISKFNICRKVWLLHRCKGQTREEAIGKVALEFKMEESAVESIWKRAPKSWRRKPSHIDQDKEVKQIEKK